MKIPVVSAKEAIKALHKMGFRVKRITGSHAILIKEGTKLATVVPIHGKPKEIPLGTLRSIIKQANLTVEEFVSLL